MQLSKIFCRTSVIVLGVFGIIGSAQAQGTVQLYGTADLGVGRLASQAPGAPNAPVTKANVVHSGGVQTSYFGMSGSEDLGGGLKAKFQLESFIRMDTGETGRFGPAPVQDPLFSRAAWVGLEGGLGEVRLGLNSNPAWLSMVFSSAMGSNSLFSPSFRQQYNGSTRGYMGLDTGLPNSVTYTTPRWGGLQGTFATQLGEGRGGANYSGNIVYRGGPLMLTLGAASTGHTPSPNAAAVQDQDWYVLGASYDFKVVKLFGQYTDHDDNRIRTGTKTPHFGVTMPLGNGELQAAWARAKTSVGATSTLRTTTSLGYIYNLSRRTSLYAMLASDKLPVGTANSQLVGIRHTF